MIKKEDLIEFYGNRGYKFDLVISVVLILILLAFKIKLYFITSIVETIDGSVISFLGIIVGFLLTTFSLLFLYNPEHSKELTKLRKHKEYKNMLYALISTAFIFIILIAFLFSYMAFNTNFSFLNAITLGLIVFSFLRITKCIFYLFVIIELS